MIFGTTLITAWPATLQSFHLHSQKIYLPGLYHLIPLMSLLKFSALELHIKIPSLPSYHITEYNLFEIGIAFL
jgi:hypothetical protein